MIGQSLSGRYTIESKLGEGGMGEVFRGHDTTLQRPVAIKILPPDQMFDRDRKRRFIQEARAASALNHPHIITVFDAGCDNGRDFMVMEYVAGKTLQNEIPTTGLPIARALQVGIAIASALAAAHRAGIIHRDLKPSNVMLTDDGSVKVLDFGIAKLLESPEASATTRTAVATSEGVAIGTPAYMSPEQAQGRAVDARSDIFSFGSLLFEMVTGARAFHGESSLAVAAKVLKDDPILSERVRVAVPELAQVIGRCLRKNPERRYQTMADLKVTLEDVAEAQVTGAPRRAAPAPLQRWTAIALPLTLLVLALAVTYYLSRRSVPSSESPPTAAVPLTALPGQVRFPAISPDGDRVAFSWTGPSADNSDIYVQQVGAGAPLRLTSDKATDSAPAWSPDGKAIAFMRRIDGSTRHEVRTVPPLGGPERKITDIELNTPLYRPLTVAWCADSSCVIAPNRQASAGPDALFVIDVASGRKRQLTFPPPQSLLDTDPAVAPDGRSLAFRRDFTPFTGEMFRLPLGVTVTASGEALRLTDRTLSAARPAWLANSRDLVFSAKNGLWRMNALDGSPPARLPFAGLDGSQPAVSAVVSGGGSRLVYVRVFSDSNIWRVDVDDPTVPTASRPRLVVASTRSDHFPMLSPSGKRLAFFSGRSGEWELWVGNPDGSDAIQLTTLNSLPGFGRWSPDSTTLTFHSDPEGHPDVMTVAAEGGPPRIATPGPTSGGYPSFSRDGRFIYFSGPNTQGQSRILKIGVNGGETIQVSQSPGALPIEGYDRTSVFYVEAGVGVSSLWRQPLAGGAPLKVLDGVINGAYDVAENGIYYIEQVANASGVSAWDSRGGEWRLRYYAFATKRTTTIADDIGPIALGLSTSRDGRTVFFARVDASADELMLVDNFR